MSARGLHAHWPAWSHDARHVYFVRSFSNGNREPSEVYRVPVSGGEPERVLATSRRAIHPAALRDGSGLLYAANPDGRGLGLFFKPFGPGAPRRLTIGAGEYAEPHPSPAGDVLVATHVQSQVGLAVLAEGAWKRITDGETGDVDPTLSPDGARIAFSSTRGGSRNIWLAEPGGAHARPLTTGDAFDEHPAFSPDGKTVAFVSDRGGERGIWLISTEGGAPRLLARAVVLDTLAFARDGSEIYFTAPTDHLPAIFRVAVASGRIMRFPTPPGAVSPAASPVADEIAYLEIVPGAGAQLRVADLSGRRLHADLPEGPGIGNGAIAWSRDGRRLVAHNFPGIAGTAGVYTFDLGAGTAALTLLPALPLAANARGVCFTPDGGVMIGLQESTSEIVLLR
jgi:Tol biopolymer transport system component